MSVALKLFLIVLAFIVSVIDVSGKVVLVAPVLAPPTGSKARTVETAKDFPVLTLLAATNETDIAPVEESVGEMQPIYVKKLNDQKRIKRRYLKFRFISDRPSE
ncbi:hypothetical protein K1T71_002074 [Dendrolimus kikuchii]|uniref:Uncharacterized protein n=1 Tax=Dendrolimus kikuchii TaxID=765133 RepID=A0ACC1DFV9_9NEOP|nr:hypothetical protein K1T71_002074 [Dendrolimus kikuchii]